MSDNRSLSSRGRGRRGKGLAITPSGKQSDLAISEPPKADNKFQVLADINTIDVASSSSHLSVKSEPLAMNAPDKNLFLAPTPNRLGSTLTSNYQPSTYQQALKSSDYITTPAKSLICPIENYLLEKPLLEIIDHIFPNHPTEKKWYFFPEAQCKDRLFFEAILTDTKSAEITHQKDPRSSRLFSQMRIKKVFSEKEWAENLGVNSLWTYNTLVSDYPLKRFNYHDYKLAWYNVLYFSNFNHSWFIFFDKSITSAKYFPNWFIEWFHINGPVQQIFPTEIMEGYNVFKGLVNYPDSEKPFQFFWRFRIPWILSWSFTLSKNIAPVPSFTYLIRFYRVKWWQKYEVSFANKDRVLRWWNGLSTSSPKASLQTNQESQFLAERARLVAELAQISSPEELLEKMMAVTEKLATSSQATSSPRDLSPGGDENGDDCYGMEYLQESPYDLSG